MYELENDDEIEIDLRELFLALKKKIVWILLTAIVFAGASGLITKFAMTPIYSSTAQLYVVSKGGLSQLTDLTMGSQLTQDYMVIVKTRPVLEQVIADLKLDMDYKELEKKITVEDVKYALSSHFQGTPFDPYAKSGDGLQKGKYRAIGINRTDLLSLIQIRPYMPEEFQVIQWVAFASNPFNVLVPFYPQVSKTPEYMANTTAEVSTENFYWASRMIAAMADAAYAKTSIYIERYRLAVGSKAHALIIKGDKAQQAAGTPEEKEKIREEINEEMAAMLKKETGNTLNKVLFELSASMKNAFSRSDA